MQSLIKIGAFKVYCRKAATMLRTLSSQRLEFCHLSLHLHPAPPSQFYIPLFVYVLIAIAVFVFLIFKVSEFSFSDASLISRRGSAMSTSTRRSSSGNFANGAVAMDDERIAERNMILVRLGIQLFVMPFFFVPDRCEWKLLSFLTCIDILAPTRYSLLCRVARFYLSFRSSLLRLPFQHIIYDQHIG